MIDGIEAAARRGGIEILPPADFATDRRECLAGVHLAGQALADVAAEIRGTLGPFDWSPYFLRDDSLHLTVKNVRVARIPRGFTAADEKRASRAFAGVVSRHRSFRIFSSRLLLLPHSLTVMFTSDPALDDLVGDLDRELALNGVADDKRYVNSRHFVLNMTIARYDGQPPPGVVRAVDRATYELCPLTYRVDDVALVAGSPVLTHYRTLGRWDLAAEPVSATAEDADEGVVQGADGVRVLARI